MMLKKGWGTKFRFVLSITLLVGICSCQYVNNGDSESENIDSSSHLDTVTSPQDFEGNDSEGIDHYKIKLPKPWVRHPDYNTAFWIECDDVFCSNLVITTTEFDLPKSEFPSFVLESMKVGTQSFDLLVESSDSNMYYAEFNLTSADNEDVDLFCITRSYLVNDDLIAFVYLSLRERADELRYAERRVSDSFSF
ncbi:hypothetical protein [Phaeocystidibacter luteus]|uniref:Uncharacterized protein n=1 Tax=Phaeocystidibacter luteus TaxID=911197 RepID=A0A6N6RD88_9FLAO|nr:hypothetical protein [Phaeocystidibacter luteus]KAB2807051.1 hypothetical protein F8C67_12720 [Phaeocystidibacter luteus]